MTGGGEREKEKEKEKEKKIEKGSISSSINGNKEEIDTSKADRAVWLMKTPPVVSRSWVSQTHHHRTTTTASHSDNPPPLPLPLPLGKVILSIDPLRPDDDPQFKLELPGNDNGNAPKSYSLDMSKDLIPMCVFSQTSEGKIAVEGKVLNKFDMSPHHENIGNYSKLCRERTNKYMVKTRQVKVIENDRGEHMIPKFVTTSSTGVSSKDKNKTTPTKPSDNRRSRRDRGEMEAIIFKLFERQPNWTLRQLIQETDQPEQFLKDILKDLCVYNNRGANQGTYELKPEYKRSVKETSSDN